MTSNYNKIEVEAKEMKYKNLMLHSIYYYIMSYLPNIILYSTHSGSMNVMISVPDNLIYAHWKEGNQALSGVSPSHQIDTARSCNEVLLCFVMTCHNKSFRYHHHNVVEVMDTVFSQIQSIGLSIYS